MLLVSAIFFRNSKRPHILASFGAGQHAQHHTGMGRVGVISNYIFNQKYNVDVILLISVIGIESRLR